MIILQALAFTVLFILGLAIYKSWNRKRQYAKLQKAIDAQMYHFRKKYPSWSDAKIVKKTSLMFRAKLRENNIPVK